MAQLRRQTAPIRIFETGTLWNRIRETAGSALQQGALEPIQTRSRLLEDRGVRFLVRTVSNLRRKPKPQPHINPFLPFEPALHVADASATHACILNKYNVVDHHLLIVTRIFEHQESLVTLADFRALWRCMSEFPALGFYNSGTLSGASQPHKHLQMVPLPLIPGDTHEAVPMDQVLADQGPAGKITTVAALPFRHKLVRWAGTTIPDVETRARQSLRYYHQMLRQLKITVFPDTSVDDGAQAERGLVGRAYNLLVTRRWMMLVPRLRERFESISLNSLAFAGALLVQTDRQLEPLRLAGPFHALSCVASPRTPPM